jgi:hypothetical protein
MKFNWLDTIIILHLAFLIEKSSLKIQKVFMYNDLDQYTNISKVAIYIRIPYKYPELLYSLCIGG